MNIEEKSQIVRRITGRKLYGTVEYQNDYYSAIFTDPTLDVILESDWVYKNYYDTLEKETSILTLEQSYKVLIDEGKWNQKLEDEFAQVTKDLIILHKSLAGLKFNKAALRATKKTIEDGKKRLEELYMIKNQLKPSTIEYMADRMRKRFIISKICDLGKNSYMLENQIFKDVLRVYYFEESGISESVIRELARSDPWRLYWTTSKDTGTPLFPHSCVEMTDLQASLVLWSKVYDFAYSSSNRPSDEVINDDDQFDAWYKEECDRIDADNNQNQISDKFGSATEVFIPADAEGAKEVYALNNSVERQKIARNQNIIAVKGEVKDQALPDVKERIQMEVNKMNIKGVVNGQG